MELQRDTYKHLLIIEDDETLARGLALALASEALEAQTCSTLREAREAVRRQVWDLLLLDINLPDGSGVDFLRTLRETDATPVILLTANDTEMDMVTGLETGADDYVAKPFSLAVLRARVNTQLRREHIVLTQGVYQRGAFRFDFDRMEFSKEGRSVELSKTEQKLLRLLAENEGITVTRAQLVDRVWSSGADFVDENALSVTIKRLRDKLEDTPSKPTYITTVYGLGYVWNGSAEQAELTGQDEERV